MYKIPFYLSGFVSYFVPGRYRRRRVRGTINVFLFYIPIARFIRRIYGVKTKKIRFVRQVSMNRITCVVNDRYYVKIFRDVSVKQLNDYKFLLNFIRPHLFVNIPDVFVADYIPMYVADRLPGKDLLDFDKSLIMKNEKKIKTQVFNMIKEMQAIPVKSIPENERFVFTLQQKMHKEKIKIGRNSVLAHLDLNASNLLMDKDLNVISVVDWDSLSIVSNPQIDKDSFENLWNIFKNSKK